jgi:hypothetical protein
MKNNEKQPGVARKATRYFKNLAYLTGLAGIILCSNACMTMGYVDTEPSYVIHSRPPQPSNLHIWIDGDWGWNRTSHAYVQKSGYWHKPVKSRTYNSGHWQASPKGHSWTRGSWKRQNR